jgi:hypothetical protein
MEWDNREEQGGRRGLVAGRAGGLVAGSKVGGAGGLVAVSQGAVPFQGAPSTPENTGSKADPAKYRAKYRAPLQAQIA